MMKKIYIIATFLITTCFFFDIHAQQQLNSADYNQKLQKSSLLFMENKGQVADDKGNLQPDILFTANNNGAKIYLTSTGIHYQFIKLEYPEGYELQKEKAGKSHQKQTALQKQIKCSSYRFTLELEGANQQPAIKKQQQSTYTENYYLAHCPDGVTGVSGYEKIVFENVYPDIDWVLYSKDGFMEYDFLVHPGGNPAQIRLKVKDAESVSITESGELLMKTSLGEVKEKAPVSYAGGKIISTRFKQFNNGTIGFDVQSQPGQELRIDPSVTWSTYYGNSNDDFSRSCTSDGSSIYLSGETLSTLGIASGGYQNVNNGNFDAFLVKFNPSGIRLWATYYGGAGYEDSYSCATDPGGSVYMAGETSSATGIASGGFQNTYGGQEDAYLVKFSSTGTRMWATYYGGSDYEGTFCCKTDNNSNVYLAGETLSTAGIASGGFQNTYGGGDDDGFIVKFNSSGGRLWASYYGGGAGDVSTSCTIESSGNVYLTGATLSTTGIASAGFQNTYGGGDGDCFLVKFNSAGSRLWATYYGGSGYDVAYSCTLDVGGNVLVAGGTLSASGIASGGFQNTYAGGSGDGFLVKFNSAGNRLWGTYYGGSGDDFSTSCITDGLSNIYLSGETASIAGIAAGGFQNTYGGGTADGFIAKFNSAGNRFWGSYYGGSGYENNYFCTLDGNANVYVAGETSSATGISSGGFQNTFGGGAFDAYLAKIDGSGGTVPVTLTSVKAYQQLSNIRVEWTVQQESNVKSYEIEKSPDGNTFTKAGEKPATGNTIYHWPDLYPKQGNNFYRLRIVDMDGKIKYSQIVKVVISKGKPSYQIFPNPITGNAINLSLINQPSGIYTVRLFNALSQVIFTKQISHTDGSRAETINFNRLTKGNYLLEVTAPNMLKQSFKVVY